MKYTAPRWLPGGHAQTIYAATLAPRPHVTYRRERWETPDRDFIDLDWLTEQTAGGAMQATTPLVVLFHGLEGGSRSHYAAALMAAVRDAGWRGCVVHFRGCSGEPNRLPRAYHCGDSAEIDWILARLRRSHRHTPLYAAGVSLGGNTLLKWLGEAGTGAGEILRGAAAISAPVDVSAAGAALGRGFNIVYTRHFLATLKPKAIAKLSRIQDAHGSARLRSARTMHAFDDAYTAPLHGFRNADDYWSRASAKPLLGGIAVPTLMVNARNDPFLPCAALPTQRDVSPHVVLEQPDEGGHVGFVDGPFPGHLGWLPRRMLAFFRARDGHVARQ